MAFSPTAVERSQWVIAAGCRRKSAGEHVHGSKKRPFSQFPVSLTGFYVHVYLPVCTCVFLHASQTGPDKQETAELSMSFVFVQCQQHFVSQPFSIVTCGQFTFISNNDANKGFTCLGGILDDKLVETWPQ